MSAIDRNQPWYAPPAGVPPYIRFDERLVEDRNATIEDGILRYKSVPYVIVQAAGAKETFEKVADEWLSDIDSRSRMGMYPQEWVTRFREMFRLYLAGQEIPDIGTPLKACGFLSLAEQAACISANIKTLEGLAEASEQAMMAIGPTARSMKAKALAALAQQQGGKVALKLDAMQVQIDELQRQLSERESLLEKQAALLAEKGKAK